jgi:hypothetical protein
MECTDVFKPEHGTDGANNVGTSNVKKAVPGGNSLATPLPMNMYASET